jgi:preprotein translocase subunit SecE
VNGERNEDVVEDSIRSRARNRPTGKQRVSNVAQRRAGRVEAAAHSGSGTATLTRPGPRPQQPSKQQAGRRNSPVRWIGQLFKFFSEVLGELRKVIWPNRNQMVTYTTVVLIFLAVMVSLIGGLDFGFIKIVSWLFG